MKSGGVSTQLCEEQRGDGEEDEQIRRTLDGGRNAVQKKEGLRREREVLFRQIQGSGEERPSLNENGENRTRRWRRWIFFYCKMPFIGPSKYLHINPHGGKNRKQTSSNDEHWGLKREKEFSIRIHMGQNFFYSPGL